MQTELFNLLHLLDERRYCQSQLRNPYKIKKHHYGLSVSKDETMSKLVKLIEQDAPNGLVALRNVIRQHFETFESRMRFIIRVCKYIDTTCSTSINANFISMRLKTLRSNCLRARRVARRNSRRA